MDLRQLIQLLQQSTPSNVGVGQLTEAEARRLVGGSGAGQFTPNDMRRLMQGGMDGSSIGAGMGNLTEAEAARINQLLMQMKMDEFSRQNAYMSNPQAAQGYQQANPLGNTMTNIAPQAGGMAVRQAPMDLSTLLRMLSR